MTQGLPGCTHCCRITCLYFAALASNLRRLRPLACTGMAWPSHPPPLTHLADYIPGLTGTMATRTRVTVAGAIVSAVADLLLMMLIGELTGFASRRSDAGKQGRRVAGASRLSRRAVCTARCALPAGCSLSMASLTTPPVSHALRQPSVPACPMQAGMLRRTCTTRRSTSPTPPPLVSQEGGAGQCQCGTDQKTPRASLSPSAGQQSAIGMVPASASSCTATQSACAARSIPPPGTMPMGTTTTTTTVPAATAV